MLRVVGLLWCSVQLVRPAALAGLAARLLCSPRPALARLLLGAVVHQARPRRSGAAAACAPSMSAVTLSTAIAGTP